jgi:hypothetical protein
MVCKECAGFGTCGTIEPENVGTPVVVRSLREDGEEGEHNEAKAQEARPEVRKRGANHLSFCAVLRWISADGKRRLPVAGQTGSGDFWQTGSGDFPSPSARCGAAACSASQQRAEFRALNS